VMLLLPASDVVAGARIVAAAIFLLAGLALLRRRTPGCASRACGRRRLPPLLRGVAWAAMPCGLLYAAVTLAMLSGGARAGAQLLAAFALGTLPLTGGAALLLARMRVSTLRLRRSAAMALILASVGSSMIAFSTPLAAWCEGASALPRHVPAELND
jgi:sulfite exporter TauE/SafE